MPESESNTPESAPVTGSDTARTRATYTDAIIDLIRDPARTIAYLLAIAVIAAVFLRFELPGEFWAAFTGIVSGISVKARSHKRSE